MSGALIDGKEQLFFATLGNNGCYLLSLIRAGYRNGCVQSFLEFAIHFVLRCVNLGYVRSDLYVLEPVKILQLVGVNVHKVEILLPEEVKGTEKVLIGVFKNQAEHFVLLNEFKKVVYDPLGESLSVRLGKLVSTRAFY